MSTLLSACDGGYSTQVQQPADRAVTQHILFVGDSFTHGRYLPIRQYNNGRVLGSIAASNKVVDENYGQTGARAELPAEAGPDGGIPGIFAEFAAEFGRAYDVHIEAISATSLRKNYAAAQNVIDTPLWNAVVLQDISLQPVPFAISQNASSAPADFCSSVAEIEAGVHGVAPSATIYLYETWAPADTAATANNALTAPDFTTRYNENLSALGSALHNAYVSAASHDGHIAGVAPVGDAWARAWAEGVADPNPYIAPVTGVSLDFGYQPESNPATNPVPAQNAAGFHHPSPAGAYLSALVLFEKITGSDVRRLGPMEQAAATLGISHTVAFQLQIIANEAVMEQNMQPLNQAVDPCTIEH